MTQYDQKFFQLWETNKANGYSQYPDYPAGAKIYNTMHQINPATIGYELVALSSNTGGIINTIATVQNWDNSIPKAARDKMRADMQTFANQAIDSNYVVPDNTSGSKADCPKCNTTTCEPKKMFGLDEKVVFGGGGVIGGILLGLLIFKK